MSNQLEIPGPDGGTEDAWENNSDNHGYLGREYLFELRQMVNRLRNKDGIVSVECEFYSNVPEVSMNFIEDALGTEIPKRIKAFYTLTDGFELSWDYLSEDEQSRQGGRIYLYDFAKVFDHWLDELWSISSENQSEDFLLSLRGFDQIAVDESGYGEWIVICVEEQYPTFDLFLFDESTTSFHLIDLTVEDYLRKMLDTKGFKGWQYLFVEDDILTKRRLARLREFFDVMERYFPDTDLSLFERRSDQIDL